MLVLVKITFEQQKGPKEQVDDKTVEGNTDIKEMLLPVPQPPSVLLWKKLLTVKLKLNIAMPVNVEPQMYDRILHLNVATSVVCKKKKP